MTTFKVMVVKKIYNYIFVIPILIAAKYDLRPLISSPVPLKIIVGCHYKKLSNEVKKKYL